MLRVLATLLVLWFIYAVREIFPPLIVGAIVAYLMLPIVKLVTQFKFGGFQVSIGLATAVIYLFSGAAIAIMVAYLVPGIWRELIELSRHQQEIIEGALNKAIEMKVWEGDSTETASRIREHIGGTVGNPTEFAGLGEIIAHSFLFLLVSVVSSIYITIDSSALGRFFLRYLPVERHSQAIFLATRMNKLLTRYVHGQLVLIVLMSGATFVFLQFVLHMKYALPVAFLSGVAEIVPVIGPIVAVTTAALVAIWQASTSELHGIAGLPAPLAVIIYYIIIRWTEDYLVVPKVIGHAVELHPLLIIFAVMCGEEMGGGLGMLIAIPMAACLKLLVDFWYDMAEGNSPPPTEGSTASSS
jgi:predicted PurR-regulated permease PerM